MESFNKMIDWFVNNGHDKAIVALSGGVDSAVAALAAKKALGNGAIAITANYMTLAKEELEVALRVAREIGIEHKVIEYNELENTAFVKNDTMRSLLLQDGAWTSSCRRSKNGWNNSHCRWNKY